LELPEIVAGVEADTAVVFTGKSAEVAPPATVTLAATDAAPLPLESATTVPPAGATLASVTVPVEELPRSHLPG